MAKIVITSDLHLGITSAATLSMLVEVIAAEEPILTVLAGDIGEGLPNIVKCLELFAHIPGEVAVLAGNHDLWTQVEYSSQELWEKQLPEVVQAAGMLWLEGTSWQRDGIAVAGSLAWYDYSAVDPAIANYPAEFYAQVKGKYNMDALRIDWPWSDQQFAAQLGDAFIERLQQLEDDPNIHSILVASHVPLFEEQMHRKSQDLDWSLGDAYFGNLSLGRRIAPMHKVQAVVSGHTHLGIISQVPRPEHPEKSPLRVSVLGSDYHTPIYTVIETGHTER